MNEPRENNEANEIVGTSEVGIRNKSKVPKNHLISNVIRNMSDSMVNRK